MITSRRMKDGTPIMDIDYTTKVATPHIKWATPYHGGALKAFFMPEVKGGRDFVELMERLQVDATSVTHDRAWDLDKWGFGDFYDKRVRIWEYETVYGYMVDALEAGQWYDVMVMTGVNGWGYWPVRARQAILRRVKEGAGLVIVHPFDGPKRTAELAALSPLVGSPVDKVDEGGYAQIAEKSLRSAPWHPAGEHFITDNFPFDAIPYEEMAYYPYKAAGDVIITAGKAAPIAAVKEVGKGRVVAFGYYNRDIVPQHKDHIKPAGGLSSNSDFWRGGFSRCTWNYNEYFYALLGKAAVWAAGKESGVSFDARVRGRDGGAIEVTVSGDTRESYDVEVTVDNQWGNEEAKMSGKVEGGRDECAVAFPLPADVMAGGAHFANVVIRSGGGAVNWGAVRFDVEVPAAIAEVKADKEIYKPGEKVRATVATIGGGKPRRIEVALIDAFGGVVAASFHDMKSGETLNVELSRDGVLTPQMWVRARLTSEGRLFDEKKSARLTAVPDYDRNIHDAELVVAQYDRGKGDWVETIRKQLLAFGATGGYYGYSKFLAESGAEGGGVYWYHRAPYTERKEKYFRTRDKKYLERVPCLSDPEFLNSIHEKIVRTAALGTKYAPLSYYVQDEGSLTCYSDEYDLCFGKPTLQAMRKWLKAEYKDVRKLNAEWGTKFTSWEKVTPMTLDEARAHGNLAPWADHRTFMETAFADYFKLVRDSVREVDPTGRIRLSGCQVSSAYTGMDYWRLHQIIEYFEAYGGGNQFEFHQSFAGPRTILGHWIGYGQSGAGSNHKIWDAYFHQIRLFSVFWEFCVLNPDFTLSGSAEDMAATFRQLRGSGVSKMLFDARRDNSQIAVHYSYPSIHATTALGRFERFNADRQGWLNILQERGYQQTFLSRQQIEAGDLVSRKFKVLIMPLSMAVSAKEAAEIRRFVKGGGAVIGDFQTAVLDEHCKWLDKGRLDDVFGIERLNMNCGRFYINGEARRTKELPTLDVKAVEEAGVIQEEPGVRAKGGKALFLDDFSRHIPALVVNKYGKGQAAYLNFGADVCAGGDADKAQAVKSAVGEVLTYFGVKPIMKVTKADGQPLDRVEMFGYQERGVRYFAMLRENVAGRARLAYDGIMRDSKEGHAEAEKITVTLPVRGHLYDCLAKKSLGLGDAIQTEIGSAQAKVYAVYPYEIKDLVVNVKQDGNTVEYDVAVIPSKGAARQHTVVLTATSPSGEASPIYSQNLAAKGGRATGRIAFSLENEDGAWTLKFTEAASGITKSVEVLVP